MLRVVIRITITQQKPEEYSGKRDNIFNIDFAQGYEVVSAWHNMTDTATLQLPKSVVIRDKNNRVFNLPDTNKPIGATQGGIAPVFMRGDKITINHGYGHHTPEGEQNFLMTGDGGLPPLFEGYITDIKSGDVFELRCEDNMWKLKQKPAPNKSWVDVTIEKMISEMIQGTGFKLPSEKATKGTAATVATTVNWSAGTLLTSGMSVAKVLQELRDKCHLECYFRRDELRVGLPIYYEEEARTLDFCFSGKDGNIIDDDLEYKLKEDMVMSAVISTLSDSPGGTNHRGKDKTKTEKLEILVSLKKGKITVQEMLPGESVPANEEGERRTFPFTANTPKDQMIEIAKENLLQYCYTGFRGHFTTFGMPFVKHGDNVKLNDPKQADRTGTYKVKSVTYKGGVGGLRQEIHLDYKLP